MARCGEFVGVARVEHTPVNVETVGFRYVCMGRGCGYAQAVVRDDEQEAWAVFAQHLVPATPYAAARERLRPEPRPAA